MDAVTVIAQYRRTLACAEYVCQFETSLQCMHRGAADAGGPDPHTTRRAHAAKAALSLFFRLLSGIDAAVCKLSESCLCRIVISNVAKEHAGSPQ